ncbi:MAG: hypothetical protein FWG74_03365, partial [Planctomycetes bacterium]|nr:hypothetical protein [Planctomycetota bacterium]
MDQELGLSAETISGNREPLGQEDEPPQRIGRLDGSFSSAGMSARHSGGAHAASLAKTIRFPQAPRTQLFRKRYFPSVSQS